MADEQTPAQPSAPALIGLSESEARGVAAQQHLAAWLAQEQARLEHELAYVREAAAHARAGLYAHLARTFGVDAAHDPVTIDLAARTITVATPQPATQPEQE